MTPRMHPLERLVRLVAFGLVAAAPSLAQLTTLPTTRPAAAERMILRVTVDSLFLRCRADLNSTPVIRVEAGTLLQAEGKEYAYYRIVPPPEAAFYVGAEYVRETGENRGVVEVSTGSLRVRAGSLVQDQDPNTADVVARIENGTELTILGKREGWLKVRAPAGVYVYALDDYVTQATPEEVARFRKQQADGPRPPTRPTSQPSAWRTQLDEIGQLIFKEASAPRERRDWNALERRLGPLAAQREDSEVADIARRWIEIVRQRAAESAPPASQPATRPGP